MGDQDQGEPAFPPELLQQVDDLVPGVLVEVAGGLAGASCSRVRSLPSKSMVPEVGRSSTPSRLSSVDLPCPVRPWIASHSPSPIARLRSRTAGTVRRPLA